MDFHPLRKIHPVREIGNVFPGMDAQGLTVKQDLSFGCCQQAVDQLDQCALAASVGA